MNKTFILFDLDGTICDSREGIVHSIQHTLQHYHIEVRDDELLHLIGPPLRESFQKYFGLNSDEAERATQIYRAHYSAQGIRENTLYPEINSLLRNLREKGKVLLLATSKPTIYAKRILEQHGLNDYFAFIAGAELDGSRDSKMLVIRYALENVKNLTLEQAVMIGDREHDVLGAKAFDMESIGVLYGYGSEKELRDAGADYLVQDVRGLNQLLAI